MKTKNVSFITSQLSSPHSKPSGIKLTGPVLVALRAVFMCVCVFVCMEGTELFSVTQTPTVPSTSWLNVPYCCQATNTAPSCKVM